MLRRLLLETPQSASATPLHRYCRLYAAMAGLLSVGLGLLVLIGGWAFDIHRFRSVLPGYSEMRPNTALSLFLLGFALWINGECDINNLRRRTVQSCAGFVVTIGGLSLLEYVLGRNLHI